MSKHEGYTHPQIGLHKRDPTLDLPNRCRLSTRELFKHQLDHIAGSTRRKCEHVDDSTMEVEQAAEQ
jgi:hypothetical protein